MFSFVFAKDLEIMISGLIVCFENCNKLTTYEADSKLIFFRPAFNDLILRLCSSVEWVRSLQRQKWGGGEMMMMVMTLIMMNICTCIISENIWCNFFCQVCKDLSNKECKDLSWSQFLIRWSSPQNKKLCFPSSPSCASRLRTFRWIVGNRWIVQKVQNFRNVQTS